MSILVIETEKPESLSIVAGECGVVPSSSMHRGRFAAALALLGGCSPDELRDLEMTHLRRLKQRAAGIAMPERPADGDANALPSQL